ncbi:MAG TPA: IgGFc-binding protein, partial [Polyangiaceae bacterium]
FNVGTNTALTRAAYRVRSTVPIIAYQFNPLENVNVFSNDASLLKPIEALKTGGGMAPSYVVLGWPQTIAVTDDPQTNFGGTPPLQLRAFLTLVGTAGNTHVRVHTRAPIVAGGPVAATDAGGTVDFTLGPFDVMNLETGSFRADFTGSIVETDAPVAVFSGTEASDAPAWKRIGDRQCCADHLEEQLDPVRTAGKRFLAVVSPNRTDALIRAGADSLGHFDAPEFFRVAAATERGAVLHTTLPAPDDEIQLTGLGDFADITSKIDFSMESSEPVSLASISPSQGAAGIPGRLPGGDPSLLVIPPVEQFRANYVFLLPDKYNFDFIRIVAPKAAKVRLDDADVTDVPGCVAAEIPTLGKKSDAFVVYRCQMSFPTLDLSAAAMVPLSPGVQNDGVHQIVATDKVSVIVDGFDRNVSYAYAAGTELTQIVAR